jgi:hypothetical protein
VLGFLFSSMLLLVLTPATVVGQSGLATLTGIVSDTSGGAVPGVTVSATHQETNVVYTGVTNSAGNYVITALPIGTYVASVELAGFKESVELCCPLATAGLASNWSLAVSRRRSVVATGAVLQTTNALLGQVPRDQVERFPAVGRNVSSSRCSRPA